MHSENLDNIQSLFKALRDAVDEKQALNQRILALNKDLNIQLRGLNREINRELKIIAEFDNVNSVSEDEENINCVKETTKLTPFIFLYFDNRQSQKHNFNAPITTQPTKAFRFLWRGAEATDLIVVKKDNFYYKHIYGVEMCTINGRRISNMTLCYNNFLSLLQLDDYFDIDIDVNVI